MKHVKAAQRATVCRRAQAKGALGYKARVIFVQGLAGIPGLIINQVRVGVVQIASTTKLAARVPTNPVSELERGERPPAELDRRSSPRETRTQRHGVTAD